eukprot:4590885-Heterocapsa_arctica.AAC.1
MSAQTSVPCAIRYCSDQESSSDNVAAGKSPVVAILDPFQQALYIVLFSIKYTAAAHTYLMY